MWNSRGHAYDVFASFFPSRVYNNSNFHDTLRYEWSPCSLLSYHSMCCWMMVSLEDGYDLYDYCITLLMMLITLLMLALCML
jgi:apolipoprotein N-acyltransferase